MDGQCSLTRTGLGVGFWRRPEFWRKAFNTLTTGVLLAVLVGLPYVRWLGFSDLLAFALQSAISIVVLSVLIVRWPTEMMLEPVCFLSSP